MKSILLFPATCTRHLARNWPRPAGLLYTAKGAGRAVGAARELSGGSPHSWDGVFLIAAGANIAASLLAIIVLKPWRRRARGPGPGALAGTTRHPRRPGGIATGDAERIPPATLALEIQSHLARSRGHWSGFATTSCAELGKAAS